MMVQSAQYQQSYLYVLLEKTFLLNEEYQKKTPRTVRMVDYLYDLENWWTHTQTKLSQWKLYGEIIAHRQKFYHISSID